MAKLSVRDIQALAKKIVAESPGGIRAGEPCALDAADGPAARGTQGAPTCALTPHFRHG